MINFAISRKALVDSSPGLAATVAGLVSFTILLTWVMLEMGADLLTFVGRFPMIKMMIESGLGIRFDGDVSVNILFAVCMTHMITLLLSWTVMVGAATRMTVAEAERGTADLLFTLPVSRCQVLVSLSIVLVLLATVLAGCLLIGIGISKWMFPTEEPVELSRFIPAVVNLAVLNLAVGGIAWFFGCLSQRRALAIGCVVALIFTSLVLNFIEPFLKDYTLAGVPVSNITHFSLLKYYRPVDVVRLSEWPIASMATLAAIAVVSWVSGSVYFCKKDLPAA